MTKKFYKINSTTLFLSYFGIGYLPKAPGTWASLATLPILYFLNNLDRTVILLIGIIVVILAIWAAEYEQKRQHLHDPSWIVIDEVLGMLTTFLIYPHRTLLDYTLIFLFFRFFDIFKIWPVSYFDKEVKHGAGTILDDIFAGCYAGILLLILKFSYTHFFQ